MKIVISEKVEINYNNNKYKVPISILKMVDSFNKRVSKKLDNVLLITGEVGVGKSSLAQMIAGIYEYSNSRILSIENFTWRTQGLIDFTDKDDNEGEVILWDEAIEGATGKNSITKIGNQLKITLVTKRRKRHLYIFILDEMQEYSKKVISRANYLIDVRFRDRNYTRGEFKIYNQKQLREMYHLFKSNAIKHISQYRTDDYICRFNDPTNVFISEEDYENKKIEETKMHEESSGDGKVFIDARWLEAYKLRQSGKSQAAIGTQLGVARSTVQEWLSKLATAGLS